MLYIPGIATPVTNQITTVIVVYMGSSHAAGNYGATAEVVIHVKNVGKEGL